MPDKSFHRFAGPLPRHQVGNGVCLTCDNAVHTHQGPVAMWKGLYQVKEIASALVEVAKGVTYTEVARRVRGNYWGLHGSGRLRPGSVEGGQTIADWLNLFGPSISAHYAEDHWPETLVLDSTEYQYTNPRTGYQSQLFVILAALGYEHGEAKGHLWRVEARPTDQKDDWVEFLRALPGAPAVVVYDGDRSIGPAARQHWSGRVPLHICEHHLYKNALRPYVADQVAGIAVPDRLLLNDAFHGPAQWKAFRDAVNACGGPELVKWVAYWDKVVSAQVARRASIPAHYSTGVLDRAIDAIRQCTERRKWTFRNRERMNQMLDLVRLRINRRDNAEAWAELIRQELVASGGRPQKARQLADPVTYNLAGERVYSLRP